MDSVAGSGLTCLWGGASVCLWGLAVSGTVSSSVRPPSPPREPGDPSGFRSCSWWTDSWSQPPRGSEPSVWSSEKTTTSLRVTRMRFRAREVINPRDARAVSLWGKSRVSSLNGNPAAELHEITLIPDRREHNTRLYSVESVRFWERGDRWDARAACSLLTARVWIRASPYEKPRPLPQATNGVGVDSCPRGAGQSACRSRRRYVRKAPPTPSKSFTTLDAFQWHRFYRVSHILRLFTRYLHKKRTLKTNL